MYVIFTAPYIPINYGGGLEYRDNYTFSLRISVHLTGYTDN